MSNSFVTPSAVVRDAALFLNDELIIGNLVNRNVEQTFASKVGSSVKVKSVPNLGTADEFTSTTSASNVSESSVDVTLEKHFYKRVDITSDEATLQVDDFTTQVVVPAVRSLVRGVESYFLQKIVGGFNRNIVGTAGNQPSTHAHILAAEKKIFDNRGNNSQLVGVISSTAHASLAALNIFTSQDYGAERPAGLRSNSLGMLSGVNWFRTPNAGSLTLGNTAGTILTNGAKTAGVTAIDIDGFTTAAGTIYEGARFTLAGDATVYTITSNAVTAGSAVSVNITPALAANVADGVALTWQTAPTTNVVYNPAGVAAAILPGAVLNAQTAVANVNGLGLRIISDVSTSTLAASWVFDLYAGCKVSMNEFGSVLQG